MERTALTIPEGFLDTKGISHVFWLCKAGDPVKKGKAVAGIEASKGTKFINPPIDGFMDEFAVPTGAAVEEGMTIAYIRP